MTPIKNEKEEKNRNKNREKRKEIKELVTILRESGSLFLAIIRYA